MRGHRDTSKRGLVLTRKAGERVAINGETILEVTQIKGNSVRLRFIAPDYIKIRRLDDEDEQ